ncbi:MAG: N-acetyltransferase [Lentimicrobiaceae bacterium]|jgi:predicted GNAT family acetyltransferase|nr:N-acetyltransferase [Lentimicrobiaceae bacterium]
MEIVQYDNEKNGIFKAKNGTTEVGEMTYVWAGDNKIIIDHTGVRPDFESRGVGTQMVMKAVEFARDKNIKILPLCPFAKNVFMKNKDIHDVLD